MMKIRKFTEEGHKKWVELYNEIFLSINKFVSNPRAPGDAIKKGFTKELKKKIEYLKSNKELTEELEESGNIEPNKEFKNSYELAVHIDTALKNYKYYEITNDNKLWDWLALIFFDKIFVPEKMRGYFNYRYVLDFDWRFSMRHLIRGPWWAVNRYGESGKIFTYTSTYQQNDALEQFIKVNHMREMVVVPDIAMKLYFNKKENRAIQGVFKVQKKIKPGSFSRLKDKISHFSKVMNLWEMNSDEIIKILPPEFDQFKK